MSDNSCLYLSADYFKASISSSLSAAKMAKDLLFEFVALRYIFRRLDGVFGRIKGAFNRTNLGIEIGVSFEITK